MPQVRPEQGSQGWSMEASRLLWEKERKMKGRLGPLGYFWYTVAGSLDSLAPWQARMFLQYIFTTKAVPHGEPGERGMTEKILTGQIGRGTGGQTYKSIIGKLAGIANGSIQTRWQDKAQKGGWLQDIMASQTKKAARSGEVTGDMQNAIANQVLQGNIAPPGWKGVTSMMYHNAPQSTSNPFGGAGGFAEAVIGGKLSGVWLSGESWSSTTDKGVLNKSIAQMMDEWGAESLEDWDAIGSVAAGTMRQQSRESRRKFERERRSERGGGGLDRLLETAGMGLATFALGGTLGAAGSALAGGGAAGAGALSASVPTAGAAAELGTLTPMVSGMGPGVTAGMGAALPPALATAGPTFLNRLGQGMEWFGGALAPSLKGSFGSFGTPGPPRISGTKDIKFPYIAGGEKGVPGYWPEKWKKESLWEKMWGEYPEEMREELRQSLFEKNPYGYGDQFWTPPSGMRAWGF